MQGELAFLLLHQSTGERVGPPSLPPSLPLSLLPGDQDRGLHPALFRSFEQQALSHSGAEHWLVMSY